MPTKRIPYQPRLRNAHDAAELGSNIYQPVEPGEFRLLDLESYDTDGCLLTKLHHESLECHPPYVAISYTWDEQDKIWYGKHDTRLKPIRINGVLVAVSDKVANILCLNLDRGKTSLWIDALCINQSNLAEKALQVDQMGSVYSQAYEVRAMIGSPNAETDSVLDAASTFVAYRNFIQKEYPPMLIYHLSKFINGPYWTRAWVLQELTLGKRVILCCGSKTANLRAVVALGGHILHKVVSDTSGTEALKHWRVLGSFLRGPSKLQAFITVDHVGDYSRFAKESLLQVLQASRNHCGCQDPRDIIYSRLALASDAQGLVPHPDYTIAVDELYRTFAARCILTSRSLEIITSSNASGMNLPSWVPDWSSKERPWDPFELFDQLSGEIARLSWQPREDLPKISSDDHELTVQGRILGKFGKHDWSEMLDCQAKRFSRWSSIYPFKEILRPSDLVCVLKACPLLVHLRPMGEHFVIVGRYAPGRTYGAEVGLASRELVNSGIKGQLEKWMRHFYRFVSFEETQKLPEVVFTIR